ncbi:Uma2 family endonuclease [Eubacteriales bacterium OttesenSCG-928-A19]|nr:Uma2 family endonuclease [Eubacteriales bacterium OttesenSCG-928-A19]
MQQRKDERYTYADYITWDDGNRYELIDGEVYMMDAPKRVHQGISGAIFWRIAAYLEGKPCEVYAAPFDVRLNADAEDDTVVQPDISVICDPSKLDDRGCVGAPDMVVEILSPSSAEYDQGVKLNRYLEAGVRECWIVNPMHRFVQVNLLRDGEYHMRPYGDADAVPVSVLDGCVIELAKVFPAVPPEPEVAPE